MSLGLLILRLVLGAIMAAHGAQKLFGWWGGPGMQGTSGMCVNLEYRAPFAMACGLGLAELGGGLLLAAGLLTPLGALLVTVVMLNAVYHVHWPKGFFVGNGGYEFNLLIASAAVALAGTGPGRFSFDRAIGWDDRISGPWWAVGVVGAAATVSVAYLTLGRRRAEPQTASV